MNFYYGEKRALKDISIQIRPNVVTAFIGPSGCGKSTFLRTLNRMNDIIPGTRVEGRILIDNVDIYKSGMDVVQLRRRVGMVFQKSNPFPKSIFENIAYGLRINGMAGNKAELSARVEESLKQAALWDEVKDRLDDPGTGLSGGQQQRLCIARALGNQPQVLLMDEPCSALDPIATAKIEELLFDLKQHYTIVIVTHNMQQAARVSDYTAFMYLGRLVEYGPTRKLFVSPSLALADQSSPLVTTPRIGDPAPGFALKTLDNKTVELTSPVLKRPVVLVVRGRAPTRRAPRHSPANDQSIVPTQRGTRPDFSLATPALTLR